ncbi:MAG: c-type cytochrome [Candidatus Poseidoniales archaeon]
MREAVLFFALVFGGTGAVFAFLGGGENRNIGFNNGQCPRGDYFCGVTWKSGEPVQVAAVDPAVAVGAKHYVQCAACHGQAGEGGVGPALAGQTSDMIVDKLAKYKAGEKIGAQSAVMWGQASWMTEQDMRDIGNYVETL